MYWCLLQKKMFYPQMIPTDNECLDAESRSRRWTLWKVFEKKKIDVQVTRVNGNLLFEVERMTATLSWRRIHDAPVTHVLDAIGRLTHLSSLEISNASLFDFLMAVGKNQASVQTMWRGKSALRSIDSKWWITMTFHLWPWILSISPHGCILTSATLSDRWLMWISWYIFSLSASGLRRRSSHRFLSDRF